MGQRPMFSHLDAAFGSLDMDWGPLLKMCTPERVGPSLIGEILAKEGSCQGVNAGCLALLHGKQCRVNNGQHLLLYNLLKRSEWVGTSGVCAPLVQVTTAHREAGSSPVFPLAFCAIDGSSFQWDHSLLFFLPSNKARILAWCSLYNPYLFLIAAIALIIHNVFSFCKLHSVEGLVK